MKDSVEIIKSKISIMDIINHYGIKVDSAGFACCPFHNEKTGSLKVYKKTNTVKCFGGCGFSGDVISFVQKMENVDFQTAISYLDTIFKLGLNKPLSDTEKKEWAQKLREKEEQRLKAENMAKFERKVFDEIIVAIRENEAVIHERKPYTKNYAAYAETKDCEMYLQAVFKLKFLEWLFYILTENSNGYLHDDYIGYTYRYDSDKKAILRKIYKKEIVL